MKDTAGSGLLQVEEKTSVYVFLHTVHCNTELHCSIIPVTTTTGTLYSTVPTLKKHSHITTLCNTGHWKREFCL